jgi:hypothetical protein
MTQMDVTFRYGMTPGEREMQAVDAMREVYGIRGISFNEQDKTVRVEYDASRFKEPVVVGLLRRAGIDLQEKAALV